MTKDDTISNIDLKQLYHYSNYINTELLTYISTYNDSKLFIELNEILMEIRSILGSDFKRNELSLILKEYKYTYFPNCLKENLTK